MFWPFNRSKTRRAEDPTKTLVRLIDLSLLKSQDKVNIHQGPSGDEHFYWEDIDNKISLEAHISPIEFQGYRVGGEVDRYDLTVYFDNKKLILDVHYNQKLIRTIRMIIETRNSLKYRELVAENDKAIQDAIDCFNKSKEI